MAGGLTRSQMLRAGGATLALAGAGLGALTASAAATPPGYAGGPLPAGDLAYARLLLAAELLAVDAYTHALGSGHLAGRAAGDARLALANERAHRTYLAGVLTAAGQTPLTAADIDFRYPASAFYGEASVTKLLVTLESLALGATLGAAGAVATPWLASALAQIAANEAQHLCAFSRRAGASGFHDAFPSPMTIADASNALAAYTS